MAEGRGEGAEGAEGAEGKVRLVRLVRSWGYAETAVSVARAMMSVRGIRYSTLSQSPIPLWNSIFNTTIQSMTLKVRLAVCPVLSSECVR